MAAKKERLDLGLVRRGLAPTKERAQALVMAGQVYVDDQRASKAGMQIPFEALCRIAETPDELRFVSRGGLKLEKALDVFDLNPTGLIVLDVGASTGGFTDCLLQHGATRIYALDVGHGQLAWKIRNDPRVVVMEHTNIRHLSSLPEKMQAVVIDVSFISLRPVLPAIVSFMTPDSWVVALVKPQFEADKAEVDRGGGVISDPMIHERILKELQEWIPEQTPLRVWGLTDSPIHGRDGNREFLLYLRLAAVV